MNNFTELKQQNAYYICSDKMEDRKKKFDELLHMINEKHSENIPNPFNDNNLNANVFTDSISSIQISLTSASEMLQSDSKNKVKDMDDKRITIIMNSNPSVNEESFNDFDTNNHKYQLLKTVIGDKKDYNIYYLSINPENL